MIFSVPPEPADLLVPRPRNAGATVRPVIPRWPLLLVLLGLVVAGPAGLLLGGTVAAALTVVRLRLLVADPTDPDGATKHWWRRRPPAPVLPGFTRTVGSVEWGLVSAFDFDTALRPRLVRVAAARLAERHGIHLQASPERAAIVLGADVWEMVDPHRPPAADRSTPGPDRAALARVLDAIERI